MNPNKALWEKGDFTRIADSMRESGEELVARIAVARGERVLDVGCGDGTTAQHRPLRAQPGQAECGGARAQRAAQKDPCSITHQRRSSPSVLRRSVESAVTSGH
jgi:hypothetical protein